MRLCTIEGGVNYATADQVALPGWGTTACILLKYNSKKLLTERKKKTTFALYNLFKKRNLMSEKSDSSKSLGFIDIIKILLSSTGERCLVCFTISFFYFSFLGFFFFFLDN